MNERDRGLAEVQDLVFAYVERAKEEFEERLSAWEVAGLEQEVREVIGGLLARQVTLARELAQAPQMWTGHVAPLVLRAMADLYITFAWILGDPEDRSRKFIHYGLGQEKLTLEHRRAEIENRGPQEEELEDCQAIEAWINSQRAMFLTDINLGSWSGISTRKMAEEAGCIDFYNYVYSPFSGCAHSMWQHIARYNLRSCQNPLHGLHSVPYLLDSPIDPYYLYLGAKYLQKTFAAFDRTFSVEISGDSSFKVLNHRMAALAESDERNARDAQ